MIDFIKNIFKNDNKQKIVDKILIKDNELSKKDDDNIRSIFNDLKIKYNNDRIDYETLLIECFAIVREVTYRIFRFKHYPVQLIGGIILSEGKVAEMKTGEGKTIVALLPACMNYLIGNKVFIITSNSYLAKRDKEEMEDVFKFLGISVGLIGQNESKEIKMDMYEKDIVYGTATEFGFDFLRDNVVKDKKNIAQKYKHVAIIDEVDSILLDRGSQPLILSGVGNHLPLDLYRIDKAVKTLEDELDYEIDDKKINIRLTDLGIEKIEKLLSLDNLYHVKNIELLHYVNQSLKANYIMSLDKNYIVKDGKVVIVNKSSGRPSKGVRLNGGLHQAIEAKENVKIVKESRIIAKTTFKYYFSLFKSVSGMTGTAMTSTQEFRELYGLEVEEVPTNRPNIRIDHKERLFKNKECKFKAIIEDIISKNKKGQPVLVAANYVYETEMISQKLKDKNIKHKVLNAKQTEYEADIISKAGIEGAITISTSMAGRGTDIKLTNKSKELGGLYVLGTSRNTSKRIDNQLIGRAGRQGDVGESRFYLSLEDELFIKTSDISLEKLEKLVSKVPCIDGEFICNKKIYRQIELIQNIEDGKRFRGKKANSKYEDIINLQMEKYIEYRNIILNSKDLKTIKKSGIENLENLKENSIFLEKEIIEEYEIINKIDNDMNIDNELDEFKYFKIAILKTLDDLWINHLDQLSQIRQSTSFYSHGAISKLKVFREESFSLFEELILIISICIIEY